MNGLSKNKHDHVTGELNGFLSGYLVKKRQAAILPYLKGRQRALDVGCGIFRWQGLLPQKLQYVGIDREKSIIEHNRSHFNYEFFKVDLDSDGLKNLGKKFDLILMAAVIEHLDKPAAVLKRLSLLLQSDGIIVLTTPHPMGNCILNYGAKIRIFSRDKHQHHELLNRQGIGKIAKSGSFKITAYKRFLCGFNQLAVLEKESETNAIA